MAFLDEIKVDRDGFRYPDFAALLAYYQSELRYIYGADLYLEPDSQDGVLVGVWARVASDLMQVGAAVYGSFSPLTAQGDALDRNVKINGIRRLVPTNSTADLVVGGQAGAVIPAGVATDIAGNRWLLPPDVTIPVEGEITVTATAEEPGAVVALAGTITGIATPTRGWQTVTNPLAAIPGDPSETDTELRRRQSESTMLPSLSVMEGIVAAVASLDGVQRHRGYENWTNVTDANGVPGHSIALVVEGGDATAIARAIHRKKTAGTGTYAPDDEHGGVLPGGTTVTVSDQYGVPTDINFIRPTLVPITVEVTLTPLDGFTLAAQAAIAERVAGYINGLPIGDDILLNRLFTPANLDNAGDGATFYVDAIRIARDAEALGTANVVLAFNEIATCDPADPVNGVVFVLP